MVEIIREWLHRAESDLEEATFLLEHSRPLYDVAFFVHQAVEKYLKAYLIKQGWELEKIHDLVKLAKVCTQNDHTFKQFIPELRKITRFYFESRYPVGYYVEYSNSEITKALQVAKNVAATVSRVLDQST